MKELFSDHYQIFPKSWIFPQDSTRIKTYFDSKISRGQSCKLIFKPTKKGQKPFNIEDLQNYEAIVDGAKE